MKPTKTCYVVRRILSTLQKEYITDSHGIADVQFPNFQSLSVDEAKEQWLAYNISRKLVIKNDALTLSNAALEQFYLDEEKSAKLNSTPEYDAHDLKVLFVARQVCEEVIGSEPDMKKVFCNAVFTGGASTSRKRSMAHPALKWWARPPLDITPLALPILLQFKKTFEAIDVAWSDPGVLSVESNPPTCCFYNIVKGSRFSTVPKDSKKDRTILIEPDGNMLLQRGVGVSIRDLLKRVGIDLKSQAHNQRLAYEGSKHNSFATLDLKNASNSLYSLLITHILPDGWLDLIFKIRSEACIMPCGKLHELEMISSMGNGFTFELETLIFYCIAIATQRMTKTTGIVSVYGDDIICPTQIGKILSENLTRLGLEINYEKSFIDGPFRESCGKHYFNGIDITPFYIKESLDEPCELLRVINSYHFWATGDYDYADGTTATILKWLCDQVPKKYLNRIPLSYDIKSGLYSCLYSIPFRVRRNKHSIVSLHFTVLRPSILYKRACDDEMLWLYNHMCNRSPGCSLSFIDSVNIGDRIVISDNPDAFIGVQGELVLTKVHVPLTGALIS